MRRDQGINSGGTLGRHSPWLFLLPYAAVTAVFFVYPFLNAVPLAFHQTNGASSKVFVGLSNFAFVLRDHDFYVALCNTAIYALALIGIQLPLSLVLALLLNKRGGKGMVEERMQRPWPT